MRIPGVIAQSPEAHTGSVGTGRPIPMTWVQPMDADGHTYPLSRSDAGLGLPAGEITFTRRIGTASNTTIVSRTGDTLVACRPLERAPP